MDLIISHLRLAAWPGNPISKPGRLLFTTSLCLRAQRILENGDGTFDALDEIIRNKYQQKRIQTKEDTVVKISY